MKPKVLHVPFGLNKGGVTAVIFSIVDNLKDDVDFGCVIFRKKGVSEDRFKKIGPTYRLNCYFYQSKLRKAIDFLTRPIKIVYHTYTICKKEGYRAVHCHNGIESAYPILGAWLAGVPVRITHSHETADSMSLVKRLNSFLGRFIINRFSTDFVACSEQAGKDLFHHKHFKNIPNSVDTSRFRWNVPVREKGSKYRFINVGRYAYPKNQEFSIQIFSELIKLRDDVHLTLIGYGDNEARLRAMVADMNLEDYVDFIDGREVDVPEAYSMAHFFLLTSFREGFSIVSVEAQASGCWCFVPDYIPGKADLGAITRMNLDAGAAAWAKAIHSHIEEGHVPDKDMVNSNLQQLDAKNVARQYLAIYNQALK